MFAWMDSLLGFRVRLDPTTYLVILVVLFCSPSFLPLFATTYFLILLHELGHSLAAHFFGLRTRSILLTPIGGVADIEMRPGGWLPLHEFLIALAGPFVNFLLFFPLLVLTSSTDSKFLGSVFVINFMLLAFNLLPAFPMDGGRMLRAVLCCFLSRYAATLVACVLSWSVSGVFIYMGLSGDFALLIIGPLLILASMAELSQVKENRWNGR